MTRLFRSAALSAVATFLLIALGGLARTQTGPGCADWPRCRGAWVPPLEGALLIDWLHRSVSASIGLILLLTAILASRTPGASSRTRRVAWTAVGLLLLQSGIGALTVGIAPTWTSTLHLGLAMLLFAATLLTFFAAALDRGAPGWFANAGDPLLRRAGAIGAAAVLLLILSGAAANASPAAFACTSWPLCPTDASLPATLAPVGPGYGVATLSAALIAVAVLGVGVWRRASGPLRAIAAGALGIVVLQAVGGGMTVAANHAEWIGPIYLATLTLLLAAMLAVSILAGGVIPAMAGAGGRRGALAPSSLPSGTGGFALGVDGVLVGRIREAVADYVALTKPGIMSLLLTTTLGAMLIAAAGLPPFWLVMATLLGGVLASGGANVLNCYIDRDIDAVMTRTRHRASAAGRISPTVTLVFGVALTVVAVAELWLIVNPLAAMLALAGNLFYVFVYTLWLKRRTPHNIVIGGAAGAVPPLVGWAAVTGDLAPLAWGLFAIIFLWTPPHFWSLALLKQGEYGRVGVPMLPNVIGEAATRSQILGYTIGLMALCIALTPLGLGPLYLVATIAINGVFLLYAVRLYRMPSKQTARGMFFFSLWYLALVFGAAVVDRLVRG